MLLASRSLLSADKLFLGCKCPWLGKLPAGPVCTVDLTFTIQCSLQIGLCVFSASHTTLHPSKKLNRAAGGTNKRWVCVVGGGGAVALRAPAEAINRFSLKPRKVRNSLGVGL